MKNKSLIFKLKKLITLAMLCTLCACTLCAFLLSGCKKDDADTDETVEEDVDEDTDEEIEEDDENTDDTEDSEDDITYLISIDDAENLLDECLDGTGCEYELADRIDEEDSYYIYSVFKDDELCDQELAVNAQTGSIYVYNEENDEMLPYSDFEYYMAEHDVNVDWTGVYGLGDVEIVIMVEEPGSFSFTFYDGDKTLAEGYAYEENHVKATGELESGEKLTFELSDETVKVSSDKSDSKYTGAYEMR